jgi:hypothetical protein
MADEKLGLEVVVEGFKKFQKRMESMDDSITVTGKRWGMLSGAAKKAGKVLGSVAKVGITAVAVGAAAAAAAVGTLAVGIGKLAIEAVPVEGIGDAFRGMAADVEGGAGAMLKALNDASKGTIANRDLMMSFNQAYQLVGENFAKEQLPEAMQYLGKVSAATGEDMGFMMSSLVRGIGRLSPMILDNLGIQVDLTEATAVYAKELGVEADELTKTQQQAALMNQVLEKLAVNTADMPDVTDSAATAMAQWQANMQNFKDTIGLAFLPILKRVMGIVTELGKKVFPIVAEFLQEKLAPAVEKAIDFFGNLYDVIRAAISIFSESVKYGATWTETLRNVFGQIINDIGLTEEQIQAVLAIWRPLLETAEKFADWITSTFVPALQEAWGFIKDNAVPILAGLGAMLLAVVVPAFIAWATSAVAAAAATVAALAPVVLPILAIGAAVALLVQAWKKNWGGIQDKTKKVVAALEEYWNEVLLPALKQIWEFIKNVLWPIFVQIAEVAVDVVGKAIEDLTRIWKTVLYPALLLVWEFIQNSVIPLLEALAEVAVAVVGKAIEILSALWTNVLYPALQKVWEFVKENVIPIFKAFTSEVKDRLGPVLEWLAEKVVPALQTGLEFITKIVRDLIDFFKRLAKIIASIKLPKALDPGSPPLMARMLAEVGSAVKELAEVELPKLAAAFSVTSGAAAPIMGAVSGGGDTYSTVNNYNLSTSSTTSEGTLAMEFADMAMATR